MCVCVCMILLCSGYISTGVFVSPVVSDENSQLVRCGYLNKHYCTLAHDETACCIAEFEVMELAFS